MGALSTGWGSYITAGIFALATVAHQFKWIDDQTYQTLLGLAGAGGITFLRASTAKADARAAQSQAVIAEHVGVPQPVIAATIQPPPK